jgi:hypothetical protein
VAWQGNGMACVNQTRPHNVNQMGKTQSKAVAERHGIGTASWVFSAVRLVWWQIYDSVLYLPPY